MWQSVVWQLLFYLVRKALNISKDFLLKAIEEAAAANQLRHTDGSPYLGSEKYDYVFNAMVTYAKDYHISLGDEEKSIINTVIELAVSYLKSKVFK